MRASWLGIAILAQFALLAWQTYDWENLLQNGKGVFLRSMPVDPRDPMRGDYLRLNYAANNVPSHLYRGPAPLPSLERGDSVYTALESVGGVAAGSAWISPSRPRSSTRRIFPEIVFGSSKNSRRRIRL